MEKSDHVATPVAPPFGSAVVMVQRRPLPDQRQDVQRQRHIVAESVKNEQEVERKPRCDHNEKPTDVTGDVITPATTMHHVNFKRRNAYATAEHQPNERLMGMVQGPQNSRPPSQ
jgi:hypothetical protein